jgi:hypothetical protein
MRPVLQLPMYPLTTLIASLGEAASVIVTGNGADPKVIRTKVLWRASTVLMLTTIWRKPESEKVSTTPTPAEVMVSSTVTA